MLNFPQGINQELKKQPPLHLTYAQIILTCTSVGDCLWIRSTSFCTGFLAERHKNRSEHLEPRLTGVGAGHDKHFAKVKHTHCHERGCSVCIFECACG